MSEELRIVESESGSLFIVGDHCAVNWEVMRLPRDVRQGRPQPAYVYALTDAHGVVRYVGCTGNPKQRLSTHKCAGSSTTQWWAARLKETGQVMRMVILCRAADVYVAENIENGLIKRFSSKLLNGQVRGRDCILRMESTGSLPVSHDQEEEVA